MNTVKIQKIQRSGGWAYRDKDGKRINTFVNCGDVLTPGLSATTRLLNTGLDKKKQTYFEKALGLEEGTLNNSPENRYWSSYQIKVPLEGLTLNLENPVDELTYEVLKAEPMVALSPEDAKTKFGAEYIMTSQLDIAKSKNKIRDIKGKAYAKFYSLTKNEKVDALYMFGIGGDSTDGDIVEDKLGSIVESNPAKFMAIVGDTLFKDKVFFMKLIKTGIVKKHGTGVGTDMPLYFEDIMLGSGLEEAIVFYKSKENQATALGIKKAYEAITK